MSQDEYASYTRPQNTENAPTSSAKNDHYCIHHRKPKDIQGEDTPRNRSTVLRSMHDSWHILYGTLPAHEIIARFDADQEIYGNWIPKSDIQRTINEGWANSSKEKIKRRMAWFYLFEGKSLEDIVDEINRIWLDPDYTIQIGIERRKKIWIVDSEK